MRRFPKRFSVIVTVDPNRPEAPDWLGELSKQGAEGVRLSPGDPPAIWRKTAELGLIVSLRRRAEDTASDEASFVTGSKLVIDEGRTAE